MDSIAAIDIGTTKAVTVLADVDGKSEPRVLAVGTALCRGLRRGTVVDIEDTAQSVLTSVRRAEQMADRKISHVIVSVTGEHISGTNTQGIVPIVPPGRTITREDVNRVINHSKQIALPGDRELIHAIPRSFKVDGQDGVHRPFGMNGERLEVSTHLVSGQATHIQNLERCVNRAQIEVDAVVLAPIASGIAVLTDQEMQSGVAVVDFGGGTCDVAVYLDGSVTHTGVVPVGAQHITSDISKLLKTTIDEAERIKCASATCTPSSIQEGDAVNVMQIGAESARPLSRTVLSEIVEARTKEILTMVRAIVESSGFFDSLTSGIVITGGGSQLEGISKLAEGMYGGLPVRLGRPIGLSGLSDMISGPEFATVVGLVKHGLKMREVDSVDSESGDFRKFFGQIKSIFGSKAKT